ncbi:MAG: RtcB family protein [Micropepsaceae bacterium]
MYEFIDSRGLPIRAWTQGVPVEFEARQQLQNIAALPFIHGHVAVMPDVHLGRGATVGSVIPTKGAIIPAAVGVDIGCGMAAVMTNITASQLPDSLRAIRSDIERVIPVGQGSHKQPPRPAESAWYSRHKSGWEAIEAKHPKITEKKSAALQIGTLGGGNHFIELCLDEADRLWVMLHSGSRNVGNRIGMYFIAKAKDEIEAAGLKLADRDLAWLGEGSQSFNDYVEAVGWAQDYARSNREVMMAAVLKVLHDTWPGIGTLDVAVNCHHNYVEREEHFGERVWLTRKGAVRARKGELGIIPGSMGARSFIVRGLGNPDSFESCSHGAGRAMSRTAAKQRFSLEEHIAATAHVECRKDTGVIDETPMAYKDIDAVMAAQSDLVEIVHTLRQIVCVKG